MSSIIIKKEHLQFARHLMHPSPSIEDAFFSSPQSATIMLFKRYDLVARHNAALRARNASIEPSCFFERIIEFSGHILNEITAAIAQKQEMDPEKIESIKDKGANLSFNLYVFYIMPIFAANRFISPYLPAPSIDAFFHEIESRNPRERMLYRGAVLEFVNNCGMDWIEPYKKLAGQLGLDGASTILLMVGLFKQSCEEMQKTFRPSGPPPDENAGHTRLSPSIEKFLQDLERGSA